MFGIDGAGWALLLTAAAVVVAAVSAAGLLAALRRRFRTWWTALICSVAGLVAFVALLAAVPVGLVGSALLLTDEYREVGRVDGRVVVVRHREGWDEDFLDAGFKERLFVSFPSMTTGDTSVDRPLPDLQTWRFSLTNTPAAIQVHYRTGSAHPQNGTLAVTHAKP